MPQINPYNFVPLKGGPDRSKGYLGRERYLKGTWTGTLVCSLEVLTPLISLDHRTFRRHKLPNGDEINAYRFLQSAKGEPILQGASLKGMLRSVYEAMTDSCLTLAASNGQSKQRGTSVTFTYQPLGSYANRACNSREYLCPACRLFGTIEGDEIHCQGRVTIEDGHLIKGDLISGRIFLKELSGPKPHHHQTYGKNGLLAGQIAGRKFYYHHGDHLNYCVVEQDSNDRSFAIDEYAPPSTVFSFRCRIENVSSEELGELLLALELGEGLAHKLGVGKAVGMGSCRITVDRANSALVKGGDRYASWDLPADTSWQDLKADWQKGLPPPLIEVLRLNKPEDGSIGYLDFHGYPSQPIDTRGIFGGNSKDYGVPAVFAAGPSEQPPARLKPDEKAAWLKSISNKELLLEDAEGKTISRPITAFQAKKTLLVVGKWFILKGNKAIWPTTT